MIVASRSWRMGGFREDEGRFEDGEASLCEVSFDTANGVRTPRLSLSAGLELYGR